MAFVFSILFSRQAGFCGHSSLRRLTPFAIILYLWYLVQVVCGSVFQSVIISYYTLGEKVMFSGLSEGFLLCHYRRSFFTTARMSDVPLAVALLYQWMDPIIPSEEEIDYVLGRTVYSYIVVRLGFRNILYLHT